MTRVGMHSSLWTAAWSKEAAERLIPDAAKHGLDLIEIALLAPETVDAAHAAALLKQYKIQASASLTLPSHSTPNSAPEKAEAFLMKALEKAHELGCDILCGVTYGELGYRSGLPPTEGEYVAIAKVLKPVARRAQEFGMRLGIEPCNRYETHLLNTTEQSLAMLERIGEPNVTIHLDTYHMNIEEKGIGQAIRRAGKHCSYIHLSESDRGVPGMGTIDWDEVFRALAESGFEGDLVMESFVTLPPEISAALSVWRPVARDKDEVLATGVPYLQSLAKLHGLA